MDTTVNARFAGGVKSGKLRVGAIAAGGAIGNKASIPSRYETVLNTGVREKDAFGRRSYRFDDAENDLPGPGAYRKSRKLRGPCDVVSKKGFGGLASNALRSIDEARPGGLSPGPGSYSTLDVPGVKASSAGQPSKPTSSFRLPEPRKALKMKAVAPPPGPGWYSVNAALSPQPCAAFSSKAPRGEKLGGSPAGPGEYDGAIGYKTLGASVPRTEHPSSFNTSKSSRPDPSTMATGGISSASMKSAKVCLPAPLAASPDLMGRVKSVGDPEDGTSLAFFKAQERQAGYINKIVTEEAEKLKPPPKTQAKKPVKPSPMFAPTTLDRFGLNTVRYTAQDVGDGAGPGYYESEAKTRRMLISSAWALSSVNRDEHASRYNYHPPGPAYYNPSVNATRQSHRLASKSFVV